MKHTYFFLLATTVVALLATPGTARAQATIFSVPGSYTYIVPAGVTSLRVVATGASGGLLGSLTQSTSTYSFGGRVQATVTVKPGEVLTVQVGGQGTTDDGRRTTAVYDGGFNGGGAGTDDGRGHGGGGGGGATDLRRTGTSTGDYLASRNALLVAGGGGGSSSSPGTGGNGGAPTGDNGEVAGNGGGSPGQGATQVGPGAGTDGAFSGSEGTGGAAGRGQDPDYNFGGGGGGGYYGGGGGSANYFNDYVGGGGGSSWAMADSGPIYSVATKVGNGLLTITPIAPLPITLTTFTAQATGSAARLTWRTAGELNNDHFEVEASVDGRTFTKLANVAGHGTTQLAQQYGYTDEKLTRYAVGLVYYRLRQVDQDGKSAYSPVRTVAVAGVSLTLYPNPAHHAATLSGATASVPVQVYNTLGSLVLTTQADATGSATLALPSGLYLVRAGVAPALRLTVE
ncbi:hypothetical protein GCM10027422_47310 [Hymenobacter arcticus]